MCLRVGPDRTGVPTASLRAKRSPRPRSVWLSLRVQTVPAPMGLHSNPAFSGGQKSPGTPAHHLLSPPPPPAPTGGEDSGGTPPGPAGSRPSGRRGTVLGPTGHSSRTLAPGQPSHLMETGCPLTTPTELAPRHPPTARAAPGSGGEMARLEDHLRGRWQPESYSLLIVAGWPVSKI